MSLRWVARRPRLHSRRLVFLLDAKAVLGAASKGRTSAGRLAYQLRRIASLTLATSVLVKYFYVPSEDNPADHPSRGFIRRKKNKLPFSAKQLSSYINAVAEMRNLCCFFCELSLAPAFCVRTYCFNLSVPLALAFSGLC